MISSASFFNRKRRSPASRITALSPCRGSLLHRVLPLAASTQKKLPLLRLETPKIRLSCCTGELKRIVSSGICQAFSVVQELFCLLTCSRKVPGSPAMIRRCPKRRGVGIFMPLRPGKSIFHSRSPVASARPTAYFWVSVTTCFTPSISTTTGDAYAGPSPFHVHFWVPDFASYAATAPSSLVPIRTTTKPSAATGDIEVPNCGHVALNSFE